MGARDVDLGLVTVDQIHLRNQVQELEAEGKQTRFRKQIDIRTFAYHVA
jgi:hypothetical protein